MASDSRPSVDLTDVLTPSVRVRSLDNVVEQMREIVLSGRVRPGDRLPSERELAKMLDVSRATVREALRTMEATGLVDIRLGGSGGAFVTTPDPTLVGTALSLLLVSEGTSLDDLTEFRLTFEQENAALAAARIDDAGRLLLQALLNRALDIPDAADSWPGIEEIDLAVHELLPVLSRNSVRIAISHSIHDALRRSFDQVEPQPSSPSVLRRDVIRVARAVLSGDPDAARSAMLEHIVNWRS